MSNSSSSVPDSWGPDPEFLRNPKFLPPFVPGGEVPAIAPSRRAELSDLLGHFHVPSDGDPAQHDPHAAYLTQTYAVYADPARRRNDLLGPATLRLGEELLNRHLLLVGPPGTGKTSQILTPLVRSLIADRGRTVVLFDPKGDQYQIVRQLARAVGRPPNSVHLLNLTDPRASVGWNPLQRGLSRTEAHGIATALVMATEAKSSTDSPFWRNHAVELLTGMLLGLVADPLETPTLPRVCEVLDLPRPHLVAWLREHGCHKFAAFLDSGSHNAETSLSDTSSRLVSMLDLDLCAVLSHDELQLDRLFQKPSVLVVEMDETRIERLRGMFNVLLQRLMDAGIAAASRRPDTRLAFPASIVIDEFGSAIGAVPRLPVYLNTVRSRRIGIVAAVQTVAQIQALYGVEAGPVVSGFSSKVFFPNVERIDANLASDLCGTMAAQLPGDDSHELWAARPVYMPEEIARPPEHPELGRPVLMVLASMLPVQVYLTPSYRLPGLRELLVAQRRSRRRPRRRQPLRYEPRPVPSKPTAKAGHNPFEGVRRGISNTSGWSDAQIVERLDQVKATLGFVDALPAAKRWWYDFEQQNEKRMALVLLLAEELAVRKATITEFFHTYVKACVDNIQANLFFLDYTRLKDEEQRRRRDAANRRKPRGEEIDPPTE